MPNSYYFQIEDEEEIKTLKHTFAIVLYLL